MQDMRLDFGDGSVIPASLSIRFAPCTQLIVIVRRFVQAFYERVLQNHELASQLALATHELLENAVKYGTTDTASLAISVLDNIDSGVHVDLAIRNSTQPSHIAEAERLIAEINACDDTFAFYQERIKVASERTIGSGLGLVRIAAETGLTLESALVDDEFEIRAKAHFAPGRSP